ncbi:MAG: alpha/beta hydrolase [Variovorax sp.]|nr:alpha/beta hydrolase [Variovorax sp.]
MAQMTPAQARAHIAQVAAARPPGPAIDMVIDREIPGSGGPIPVRIYLPHEAAGVVMAFHGGGWLMGNRDTFDFVCRHLANDSGLAVVSVDYRLAPEHPFPAALDDAWEATCWVEAHGAQWQLPSGRLGLFGESAGGNLAAVVALMARDRQGPAIRAQALVYPATDARQGSDSLRTHAEGFMQRGADVAHAYRTYALGHGADAGDWRLSPLLAASHAGLPPALVVTAECDAVRDEAEAYADALAEAGVSVGCVRYRGMLHTFYSMRASVPAAALAQRQVADMLRTNLLA